MKNSKEVHKSAMIEDIRNGGAWFVTRKDRYTRIGYSAADNCCFARECFIKDESLEGGAYSFGMDWFDISFHGRYINIYADPDTFRSWPVIYDPEKGTHYDKDVERAGQAERMLEFCKQADAEALAGIAKAYQINGTNFDFILNNKNT